MTTQTRMMHFAICLAMALPFSSAADDEAPAARPSYSAEGVFRNGDMLVPFRVYHDGGRERREEMVEGQLNIKIRRPDLGVTYVVIPAAKMAMEMGAQPDQVADAADEIQKHDLTAVGAEVIGGESVTKYAIPGQPGSQTYLWLTSDGIPMRLEGNMGGGQPLMVELSNVSRGPQDASLFELPADYQVMRMGAGSIPGMPQGMPKGMPQGMPSGQAMPSDEEMPDMSEVMKQMEKIQQMQKGQTSPRD